MEKPVTDRPHEQTLRMRIPDLAASAIGALSAFTVALLILEFSSGQTARVALAVGLCLCVAALVIVVPLYFRPSRNALIADDDGNLHGGGSLTVAQVLFAHEPDPDAQFYRMMQSVLNTGEVARPVRQQDGSHRIVHAQRSGRNVIWQVLPPVEQTESHSTAITMEDAPFGHLLLHAGDGKVIAMNGWMRNRCGDITNIDDVLLDLPPSHGKIHRLRVNPTVLLRAFLVVEGQMQSLYLVPLGKNETAASNPDQFLMQLPISLARLDTDGTVIIANRAATSLVGDALTPGANVSNLMEGLAQPMSARIRDVAERGRYARPEVARLHDGDVERFLQVSLSPMVIEGQSSILMVMSDATELKKLEAQFVQSQKMQAVGQLAGGVAHDFNNLLTALSGHCDLLLLRNGPGDRDYLDLMQIQQNANRAAALVSQLLAFSRKQTLQPKIINLGDVLGDLSHLLNRLIGEKVNLRMDFAEDLPEIRADLRQVEQVVMNLVVNARDAMREGGTVYVRARVETLAEELHRNRAIVPPGEWVIVDVTDTGTGIPEREIDKIFDPFFTTKRVGEGTGLGLSTAYGIVKQTGGFLFVDSVVGEGTTFSILIPRHIHGTGAAALPPVSESAVEPEVDLLGSGTVLLVEDEAPVRAFAVRALQLRGYTVIEAASGEEALEILSERPKVDVFISDVIMPGLDGPSWVRQAQKDYPDVEVIFVSGYAEDIFTEQHVRPAHSAFLAKPFSLNDLSLQVKRSMDASRERQSAPS